MGIGVAAVMRGRVFGVRGREVGVRRTRGVFVTASLMLGFGGGVIAGSCCAVGGELVLWLVRVRILIFEACRLNFGRRASLRRPQSTRVRVAFSMRTFEDVHY